MVDAVVGVVMPGYTLDFERPILELQGKIQELKQLAQE